MEDKDFGFLELSRISTRSVQSVPIHEPDQSVSHQEQNPKSVPIYDSFRFP